MKTMFTNHPDGTLWFDQVTDCVYVARDGEWCVVHQVEPHSLSHPPPPPSSSIRQKLIKGWQRLFSSSFTFKVF